MTRAALARHPLPHLQLLGCPPLVPPVIQDYNGNSGSWRIRGRRAIGAVNRELSRRIDFERTSINMRILKFRAENAIVRC